MCINLLVSLSPPLAGLNPNMNVNCMEVGSLSLKDPPQPQSRLSQWTHSNSIDSLSASAQHMEANLNKHGINLFIAPDILWA